MALRPVPEGVHEPREAPVNLSGSRLETHEDRSPAGATCCYSLLLDPHATMTLTCTNGCSRWSPDEKNRAPFFLIRDALYPLGLQAGVWVQTPRHGGGFYTRVGGLAGRFRVGGVGG